MKRAVLDIRNIERCIENGVYAAPLAPSSLSFNSEEKMYVAMRLVDAKKVGIPEYIYLFTMGNYLGENEILASKIYGARNKKWKHFWKIKKIESVIPFSLRELRNSYSGNKDSFYQRYRGENLSTKTVTHVRKQDQNIFTSKTKLLDIKPSGDLEEDFYNYKAESYAEEAKTLPPQDLISQIKERNKRNKNLTKRVRKQKRLTKLYERDPKMGGWLQSLYENKCQVCGETFIVPSTKKFYSEPHHIIPVSEEGSNEYTNIIVVCPTCHKKFERNYLKIDIDNKTLFSYSESEQKYKKMKLKHDKHLFTKL